MSKCGDCVAVVYPAGTTRSSELSYAPPIQICSVLGMIEKFCHLSQ